MAKEFGFLKYRKTYWNKKLSLTQYHYGYTLLELVYRKTKTKHDKLTSSFVLSNNVKQPNYQESFKHIKLWLKPITFRRSNNKSFAFSIPVPRNGYTLIAHTPLIEGACVRFNKPPKITHNEMH